MTIVRPTSAINRCLILSILTTLILISVTCSNPASDLPGDKILATGTWGGVDAGVMVSDTGTHIHIGCTFGDGPAEIPLNDEGRFAINGDYVLQAFPVALGPLLPAEFSGHVHGDELTLWVAVNDTVNKETVKLGPVKLVFGREPDMGPCPICQAS